MDELRRFSPAEIRLLDAVNAGQTADYRSPARSADAPAEGEHWGDERTVSAAAIRAIIDEPIPGCRPTRAGVRITGARIAGELKLTALDIPYPLELIGCRVAEPINLSGAKLALLDLAV